MSDIGTKAFDFVASLSGAEKVRLSDYFRGFIADPTSSETECCLKYLTRGSGRYCRDCPNHPMRDNNGMIDSVFLGELLTYLDSNRSELLVKRLDESGLPVPSITEMQKILEN